MLAELETEPTTTLDPIEYASQLERERAGNVTQLAARVAAGEKATGEEIARVTQAAGITVAQFRELVDNHKRRNTLFATLARKPEAELLVSEMGRQLESINGQLRADIEAAEARFHEAAGPIQKALAEARQTITEADAAEQQLRETAPPELQERLQEHLRDLSAFNDNHHRTMAGLEIALREHRAELSRANIALESARTAEEQARITLRIETLTRDAKANEQKLSQLREQQDAIKLRGQQISREMLEA